MRANSGKMIVMEGLMLVPPERGTIIGRALWKVGGLFAGVCMRNCWLLFGEYSSDLFCSRRLDTSSLVPGLR